jgi:endonuclease/exonuclease/phosphatase family metal-dependent hydrolase
VTFRLLSYNIRHGGVAREQALSAVIRQLAPDLVVLQEATHPPVVEHLARETGMAQWGSHRGRSLGFLSRVQVAEALWHRPRLSRHAFVEIMPAGTGWRVFGVHLSAVHAAWTESRREYELRALLASIARHQNGPHVLVGDFNTVAPGELLDVGKLPRRLRALVWLSGRHVRYRTIQVVLDGGYVDAFRHVQPEEQGLTFPTWAPHVRLDYLFLPRGLVDDVRTCVVVRTPEARDASDHFPLLAEIEV